MDPFRLSLILVRLLGLSLAVTGALGFARGVSTLAWQAMYAQGSMPNRSWFLPMVIYVSVDLFYIGAGAILVLRATKFARILSRGTYADGHCQRCGYNLIAAGLKQCPECGDGSGPAGTGENAP